MDERTLLVVLGIGAVPVWVVFAMRWGKRRKAWNTGVEMLAAKYGLRHTRTGSRLEWDFARGATEDGHAVHIHTSSRRTGVSGPDAKELGIAVGSHLPTDLMVIPKRRWHPPRSFAGRPQPPLTPTGREDVDAHVEVRGASAADLAVLTSMPVQARLVAHADHGGCIMGASVQLASRSFPGTPEAVVQRVEEMLELARALART